MYEWSLVEGLHAGVKWYHGHLRRFARQQQQSLAKERSAGARFPSVIVYARVSLRRARESLRLPFGYLAVQRDGGNKGEPEQRSCGRSLWLSFRANDRLAGRRNKKNDLSAEPVRRIITGSTCASFISGLDCGGG
ncbi:hypothetical protein F5148DRAFT_1369743 [Russula earlei]|uniref:Uncharacterized protein n=1 Tax=Russula earlei TaxID=71964 RepID=A0ACC0U281_9AGAM|nr:hypothetical protein F5148DRAFT_1369743 [Russula earlei]